MKHWVWGAVGAAALVVAVSQCGGGAAGNVPLENQLWVQRMPKDRKDMVNLVSFMEDSGARFGAAQRSSAYRWFGEGFSWRRDGEKLTLTFLQANRTVTLKGKAYACDRRPFDRCLDLTWRGRTITMFSRKEWRDGADAETPLVVLPEEASRDRVAGETEECAQCPEGAPDAWVALFEAAEER